MDSDDESEGDCQLWAETQERNGRPRGPLAARDCCEQDSGPCRSLPMLRTTSLTPNLRKLVTSCIGSVDLDDDEKVAEYMRARDIKTATSTLTRLLKLRGTMKMSCAFDGRDAKCVTDEIDAVLRKLDAAERAPALAAATAAYRTTLLDQVVSLGLLRPDTDITLYKRLKSQSRL